jgi:RNA polymerase sigma factor (sigma-70 family)
VGVRLLEERWFLLVDRLAASECRRRALRFEDAEEFRGHVRSKMAERGEAILAAHHGASSVETYLHVVVVRAFHDWRRAEWGTWRPSAEAVRLGDVAIELETRLVRDGAPFDQVASELGRRFGERAAPSELEDIRRRLPTRESRPRPVPADDAAATPASDSADASLNAREAEEVAGRIRRVLGGSLATLSPPDRLILVLVFRDGLSVRAAARALGLEHKRVGRRLEHLLEDLRRDLAAGGIDRHGVLLFLENPPAGAWDNLPARPSIREVKS